jgi:hypothetical protein
VTPRGINGLSEVQLTPEAVCGEQRKNPYCKGKTEHTEAGQELGFALSADGPLYQGQTVDGAGFVVPETLTRPDIQMHHDKVAAGHQAIIRTGDLLNGVCEGVTNRGGNGDSSN